MTHGVNRGINVSEGLVTCHETIVERSQTTNVRLRWWAMRVERRIWMGQV